MKLKSIIWCVLCCFVVECILQFHCFSSISQTIGSCRWSSRRANSSHSYHEIKF